MQRIMQLERLRRLTMLLCTARAESRILCTTPLDEVLEETTPEPDEQAPFRVAGDPSALVGVPDTEMQDPGTTKLAALKATLEPSPVAEKKTWMCKASGSICEWREMLQLCLLRLAGSAGRASWVCWLLPRPKSGWEG